MRVDLHHVTPIRANVADALAELLDELPRIGQISFQRLTAGLVDRIEVIVRFLAVLELYKQGMVDILQFTNFGELMVRRLQAGESPLDVVSLADWDDAAADDEAAVEESWA